MFKDKAKVQLTWEAAHNAPTYAGMTGVVQYMVEVSGKTIYNIKWEDDSSCLVNERFLEDTPVSTHTAQCHEYWDRGLDCQCIPEGVKQAIRDGASPEEVM